MPRAPFRFRIALFLTLVTLSSLRCQDALVDGILPAGGRRAEVPSPQRFFRDFGGRYVAPYEVDAYVRAVAGASDRVAVETYGETVAGRPLLLAVVTSPANHRRREAVRRGLHALMDGGRKDVGDLPVTVWLGLSIHGDEGSPVEAGICLLYHLASSEDRDVREALSNAVVILDVCTNPDGRARFVTGVRDRRGSPPSAEPFAIDNQQPWPGGRVNHYLFDLNRDWFLQTQVESRQRVARILQECPQVLADLHEMGSSNTYYFSAPPGPPVNQHVSKQVRRGWKVLGDAIGRAFDGRRWPWWTGDVFPADFPGYGGSWPCLSGCIGFTFEQAGARGGRVKRRDGEILTLRDAMAHHAVAAWATVREAARERAALLDRFRAHFERMVEEGRRDALPFFILTPRHDPDRMRRLGRTLQRNGIAVRALKRALTLDAVPLLGKRAAPVTVPAGSLVVSSRQPRRPLVLSLLDPKIEVDADFLAAEKERARKGERSEFYDVTAWNLPLLFGVETFRAAEIPAEALAEEWRGRGGGAAVELAPESVAVLVPGQRLASTALLAAFLEAEIPVGVTSFAFTVKERSFGKGTLVVRIGDDLSERQRDVIEDALSGRIAWSGTPSIALQVSTFRTESGPDLGSGRVRPVRKSRIVVAAGRGVSAYSFGAVRWLFERGLADGEGVRVPHVCVSGKRNLSRALEEADVLVLPDGRGYADLLVKKDLEVFLRRGGTIVALRGAVSALAAKGMELLPLKRAGEEKRRGVPALHGPILPATLDTDHWIGWGLGERIAVQGRSGDYWLAPKPGDVKSVASIDYLKETKIPLSGVLTEKQAELISQAPVVVEKRVGRGRIVAFTEDVVVRGAAPGLWKLFLNASLLGPSM